MMDWNSPTIKKTMVLDDIFDSEKGWTFSSAIVPVRRTTGPDGNTVYLVTVDEIVLTTFEQSKWQESIDRNISPNRLVALTRFTGITIKNPTGLLQASFETRGMPSFGIDKKDGSLYLQTSFPIAQGFPVDLARRQLLVCMGLITEDAKELLRQWNKNPASQFNWEVAKNVASVAGTFLRSFVGL